MSQKINSAKTSTSNVPGFPTGQRYAHNSGSQSKRELMSSNVPTTTSSSAKTTSPRNTGANRKATPSTGNGISGGVPREWMAAAEASVGAGAGNGYRSSNVSGTSPAFEYPDFDAGRSPGRS